jgi:hypothetical protein
MHPEILALIQVIWLNGSQLTYVVKKLMNYVMLAKQRVKVNWLVVVFNNLYNRLRDLFALTKLITNMGNIEFRVAK